MPVTWTQAKINSSHRIVAIWWTNMFFIVVLSWFTGRLAELNLLIPCQLKTAPMLEITVYWWLNIAIKQNLCILSLPIFFLILLYFFDQVHIFLMGVHWILIITSLRSAPAFQFLLSLMALTIKSLTFHWKCFASFWTWYVIDYYEGCGNFHTRERCSLFKLLEVQTKRLCLLFKLFVMLCLWHLTSRFNSIPEMQSWDVKLEYQISLSDSFFWCVSDHVVLVYWLLLK